MTDQPAYIALPLERLLHQLEASGFRIDTSRRLRVLRAIDEEGHRFAGDIPNLKYLIAPLIARSAREQQQVYDLFDRFWAECQQEAVAGDFGPAASEVEPAAPERKRSDKIVLRLIWMLVILLMSYVGYRMYRTVTDKPDKGYGVRINYIVTDSPKPPYKPKTIDGKPFVFENGSAGIDTTQFKWQIKDLSNGAVEHESRAYHLNWTPAGAGKSKQIILSAAHPKTGTRLADTVETVIQCANSPNASEISSQGSGYIAGREYTFNLTAETGSLVEWNRYDVSGTTLDSSTQTLIGRDSMIRAVCRFRFAEEGAYTVHAKVYFPNQKDYCYKHVSISITVGSDKALLPLASLQFDQPRFVAQLSRWAWLIIFMPLLGVIWYFLQWRKKRYEKRPEKTVAQLEKEYPVLDAAPYFIPYLPQEHKITVPRDFFRIADVLRRREEGLRRQFDATSSVRATIESGGFPSWRDRANTRPAEYLFLVTRPDENNQQGRLFERLTAFLKRRDVPLTAFFHDGSFRIFRNQQYREGLDLHLLNRLFPEARLVVLGDAHGLINPYETRLPALLKAPLNELNRWPRRLILTPEPVGAWSFQEGLLHRHFLLSPAGTDGILTGLDLLDRTEEYQPGRFERWRDTLLPLHPEPNPRHRNWDSVDEIRNYLRDDPEAWRWLCALSLCAQPDWALTLAIGRAIGVPVTHDRLLRLTRIPWLSANTPNDAMRFELLRCLDPADERHAREAMVEALEAVREQTQHGFAETERRAGLAVQRFALDPHNENAKQSLRELQTLGLLSGSQLAELNFIVQEKIDKTNLPDAATAGIDGWLAQPAPRPFWTSEMKKVFASGLLFPLLLFSGVYYNLLQQPAPLNGSTAFWQTTRELNDEALTLHNEAVQLESELAKQDSWNAWDSLRSIAGRADTLFQQAINLRQPAAYPLADSNRFAMHYNQAVRGYHFYLTGAVDSFAKSPAMRDALRKSVLTTSLAQFAGLVADLAERIKYLNIAENEDIRYLHALHGRGLCNWYLQDTAAALSVYGQIMKADSLYFEGLDAQVHLRYLLENSGLIGAKTPSLPAPAALQDFIRSGQPISLSDLGLPKYASLVLQLQSRLCDLGLLDPVINGSVSQPFRPVAKGDGRLSIDTRTAFNQFCLLAGIQNKDNLLTPEIASRLIAAVPDQFLPLHLTPMSNDGVQTALARRVLRQMQRNGYWIARGPDMLNIVYVEGLNPDGSGNNNTFNEWNDRRMVIRIKPGGEPEMALNAQATTEPGRFYTLNPLNSNGAGRIAFGQYKAWADGIYKNVQPALLQTGTLKLYRDRNKDGLRSKTDPIDIGKTGIAQHSIGRDFTPAFVDKYSAGALVGRRNKWHLAFMDLVRKDSRYLSNKGYLFITTILSGKEIAANPGKVSTEAASDKSIVDENIPEGETANFYIEEDKDKSISEAPRPDRDGDGISDEADKCPDEAGTPELGGCPQKESVPAPAKEDFRSRIFTTATVSGAYPKRLWAGPNVIVRLMANSLMKNGESLSATQLVNSITAIPKTFNTFGSHEEGGDYLFVPTEKPSGKDLALFFAVDDYTIKIDPTSDAQSIATVLQRQYGYTTAILSNPTASEMRSTLEDSQNKYDLNRVENLFVFFSGPGTFINEMGYFMAKDSDLKKPDTLIAYKSLREIIDALKCRHVFVLIDASYGYTFGDHKKK